MPQSKALEVNLASSRIDVTLDPKYEPLLAITAGYHGLTESLKAYLLEVCHPYKNWAFVIHEGRRLILHNFYLFKTHSQGPDGARLFVDLFLAGAASARLETLRADALDNLLVFLQQIVQETGPELPRFHSVLNQGFRSLTELDDALFQPLVRGFHQVGRLAQDWLGRAPADSDPGPLARLLQRVLKYTYEYWLTEPDPRARFETEICAQAPLELSRDLAPLSHAQLTTYARELDRIEAELDFGRPETLNAMVTLPGFRDIVARYETMPRRLRQAGEPLGQADQWQLIFLLHMMTLSGLGSIHERTLREVNRTMARLIGRETPGQVRAFMAQTFDILAPSAEKFPTTALNLVLNLGQAVYRTDDSDTVEFFLTRVAGLGFQNPDLGGVSEDWEVKSNAAHIQNIRAWLGLIGQNPRWSKKLLSSLIIHLAVGGVFIKDTDLFPRDITALLGSDIKPVYNLVKQLCRLFPTYFSEIGAEGRLRDVSTRLDEILHRRDHLIHFLRKQAHVESSPRTVVLLEAVLNFWLNRDKAPLAELLPPGIFDQVTTSGPDVDGMQALMSHLRTSGTLAQIQDLLHLTEEDLAAILTQVDNKTISPDDRERLLLAHEMYRMLYRKYFTDLTDLTVYLEQLSGTDLPDLNGLRAALAIPNLRQKIARLLDYLETLKEIILSPRTFEIREDIYLKRHIAVDIPSMYGSYHETKFDALGLTFRLEALINTLFQELIDSLDPRLVTRAAFLQIHDCLLLFDRALKLDGIVSREMEKQLELLAHSLDIRGFSFTQYLDIFRGFSLVVRNIVHDCFNNVHTPHLLDIMTNYPVDRLPSKYRPAGGPGSQGQAGDRELVHRVTEVFLRDRIATSLSLQALDQFVSRVQNVVFQQDLELRPEQLRRLLNYDPDKAFTPISPVTPALADVIHLGAKGLGLVRMTALSLPVPPGFIVTTEVFRCREVVDGYLPAREDFRSRLARWISWLEDRTGRQLGHATAPLLLSVRSGSSISQPGMLATFLNVGLNREIAAGMASRDNGGPWFAWDCYRRFLQTLGMSAGLPRNAFDALMTEAKQHYGLAYKRLFSGEQMRQVALTYQTLIQDHGLTLETDPFEQVYQAIQGVFASWTAPRAQAYRDIMSISSDWGTAVNVQCMVFGNLWEHSGSGVLFTHNPRWSGDKLMLWGDFALANQGEDVVSGLVETLPIGVRQAEIENRGRNQVLETHYPEIYRQMREVAKAMIYAHGYGPQEIEFTFEGPLKNNLYLLQTRDMVLRERREHQGFDPALIPEGAMLGHGIGVSGGAMIGRLVFSIEEIDHWRAAEPGTELILVRGDTVPDDIQEIFRADGLLTARGGSTSHAAIVAYRLNKTCVVGCARMVCREDRRTATFGRTVLSGGDWISIDGLAGLVYSGRIGA